LIDQDSPLGKPGLLSYTCNIFSEMEEKHVNFLPWLPRILEPTVTLARAKRKVFSLDLWLTLLSLP
jgi:hypothetical protein